MHGLWLHVGCGPSKLDSAVRIQIRWVLWVHGAMSRRHADVIKAPLLCLTTGNFDVNRSPANLLIAFMRSPRLSGLVM